MFLFTLRYITSSSIINEVNHKENSKRTEDIRRLFVKKYQLSRGY